MDKVAVNQEEIEDETTNSDQQSSKESETDMTEIHQDDKEQSSHDTEHEDTRANAEIVKTINNTRRPLRMGIHGPH